MGKYMRKAKITGDVAVMELSQSSFTVRTRAKTLALQKIQASSHPPNTPDDSSLSYLQLRNRRLEKPNLAGKQQKSAAKESCRQNPEPPDFCPTNPNPRMRPMATGSVGSDSIGSSKKEHGFFVENILGGGKEKEEAEDFTDFGGEASFGENNLGFEGRERYIFFSLYINLFLLVCVFMSWMICLVLTEKLGMGRK